MAVLSLMGIVPFVIVQDILLSHAPWWDIPWHHVEVVVLLALLMICPFLFWIAKGRRWAIPLLGVSGLIWVFGLTLVVIFQKHFWLGIFVCCLGLYEISIWDWIRQELSRSYLDPRLRWWQGTPLSIPNVECFLQSAPNRRCKVARLDMEGIFFFGPLEDVKALSRKKRIEFLLRFRGMEVHCKGVPVSRLSETPGIGARFVKLSLDDKKELGDMINKIQGGGYA